MPRCAHNHVDAVARRRGYSARKPLARHPQPGRGDRRNPRLNGRRIQLARSSPPLRGGGLDHCSRASHGKEGRQRMIPGQFDYVRPGSLDEALRILRDREGEAKILSGGYSLIPLIKLRLAQPALLVDIQAIDGLDGITEDALAAHRLAGDPPPDPRERDHRRPLPDDPRARRVASATRRSATGARSAAPSRTRTPPRTGRRRCSPSTRRSSVAAPTATARSRPATSSSTPSRPPSSPPRS